MDTLCERALDVLTCANAKDKAHKTRAHMRDWQEAETHKIGLSQNLKIRPARPEHPVLLPASEMPRRRKAGTTKSKIALLHAIAHIELNAIDLAWDIIARFAGYADDNTPDGFALPHAFFEDWLKVADDEAKHFLMLEERLNDFDACYGDLPAHDGLWEASEKTATDFAARLAIVPMVLEARGLDVTPGMIEMMKQQGDDKTAEMLKIIHDDEITHVRAGTLWFEHWCSHHGLDIETHWQHLVCTYFDGTLKRPFNHPSREQAGMIRDWYEPLADIDYTQMKKMKT
ncbi:MAG: ferritin-like domain-containing protein [Alphaproteobacteria bacterium]